MRIHDCATVPNFKAALCMCRASVHTWGRIPLPPADGSSGRNGQRRLDGSGGLAGRYVLICDEAHYMQNLATKRTQGALALAAPALALILATGTPVKNAQPSNLFPLLQAIRHPLARDQKAFEKRYCGGASLSGANGNKKQQASGYGPKATKSAWAREA